MRSLAELTPAAVASSSLDAVVDLALGQCGQGPQVHRKPGDGRLGNAALGTIVAGPPTHGASGCGHLSPASARGQITLRVCERENKIGR